MVGLSVARISIERLLSVYVYGIIAVSPSLHSHSITLLSSTLNLSLPFFFIILSKLLIDE